MIDPALDEWQIADRLRNLDPRYFTTYYAIDAVNYEPVDVTSALGTLEAPYLPLVVQEAAGLPLDPSFAEREADLAALPGIVLRLRRRGRGAPLQSAVDRRRIDQGAVGGQALQAARAR